jgi:molybdopterin/thiamine biosynthesis adenylyltransferase
MHDGLNFSSQYKLFDPNRGGRVAIVGAGSVGSHAAVLLAKLGVADLTVIDGDEVESQNVPASEYWPAHVGRVKVASLREIVQSAAGVVIDGVPRFYEEGMPLPAHVISCVDSMAARQALWRAARRSRVELFVDTRTHRFQVDVFAVVPTDPDDASYYERFLHDDEQTEPAMCGQHGLKTVSMHAAAAACDNLVNWWRRGSKKLHHSFICGVLESA